MLVGVAIDELKDVKLTAQWEQSLADTEQGKGDETVFLNEIRTACAAMPGRHGNDPAGQSAAIGPAGGERESFDPAALRQARVKTGASGSVRRTRA